MPGKFGKETVYTSPRMLVDQLRREFPFSVDVCAVNENAQCDRYFSPDPTDSEASGVNGLLQSWKGEVCWMNPPYGREISAWIDAACERSADGDCVVVALVPARTSSPWWHQAAEHAAECRFLRHKTYFTETYSGKKYIPFLGICVFVFDANRKDGECRYSLMRQEKAA
jgi:site-specific DNA-methyltransferase (adenine-specific)